MRRAVFILLAMFALCVGGMAHADLVVVVNARSGIAALSRNEIINLYFGRSRQFFSGSEAQVIDLSDTHPDRARFYHGLLGQDVSQVDAYWSKQIFAGRMQPLPKAESAEDVLRWVLSHPGGVGYIDATKVDARVRVVFELGH